MAMMREIMASLMGKGQIGAGWYAVLTGAALLVVAWLLGSVSDSDPAAPYVAIVLAVAAVWQLGRGIRLLSRPPGTPTPGDG